MIVQMREAAMTLKRRNAVSDVGKKMLIYMMWGWNATFCRLLEQNGIESLYSTDQNNLTKFQGR